MGYCKNCGVEVNENQAICVKCGAKIGTGTTFCHNCGDRLPENAAVCLHCGVAAKKSDLTGDKVALALICFFFGCIGVHNFMMGETKKGIFKIVMTFCFGLSEILAIIDLVKILTDSYEISTEKLF